MHTVIHWGPPVVYDLCADCYTKLNHWLNNRVEALDINCAKWIVYNGGVRATCSNCYFSFNDVYDVENYDSFCRHCGSKMVGMENGSYEI